MSRGAGRRPAGARGRLGRPDRDRAEGSPSSRGSVVVAVHLEVRETVVDVGVTDEEVKPDPRAALAEDVIGSGDHLHAVDVALDDVADNTRLNDVAVLDS